MVLNTRQLKHIQLLKYYLRPYRWQVVLAFLSIILAAAMTLAAGTGLRYLVDQGFATESNEKLAVILLGLFIAIGLLALASFGRTYYVSWLGERLMNDLRWDVFQHILHLEVSFYEQIRAGELISRLTADTTLVQMVVGTSAAVGMRNFFLLLGGIVMMVLTSAKLSFYSLAIVPFVIIPIVLLGRRVRAHSKNVQDRVASMGGYIDECLNNIRTVQAFNHEPIDKLIFRHLTENAFCSAVQRNWARSWLVVIVMTLVFLAISFVLWVGAQDVLQKHLTVGQLSAFIFYAVVVAGSTGSFSEIIADMHRAAGAMDRLLELLSARPASLLKPPTKTLPLQSRGILAIHNVSFSYPSHADRLVLDKVTLSVAPGENLAIVGPSGAGKSTIFSLLLRFYDPQSGSIYLDGVDIKEAPLSELRSRIGLVSQEPAMFSTTIYENVLYGRPNASDEEVWRAVEKVQLQDFLFTLPHGIHTVVGARGVRLSGGQKQRIAIARAILRDPTILLLDEATNALDAESEQAVQNSLNHLMATRTTLIIAHRLSTVLRANRIIVLEHGKIRAVGTHAELVSQDSLYRRLATLQFADAVALGENSTLHRQA